MHFATYRIIVEKMIKTNLNKNVVILCISQKIMTRRQFQQKFEAS